MKSHLTLNIWIHLKTHREESFVVFMPRLGRPVETCHQRQERQHCYYDPQTHNSVSAIKELFLQVTHRNIIREGWTFTTKALVHTVITWRVVVLTCPHGLPCRCLSITHIPFSANLLVVLGSTSITLHDLLVEVKLEILLSCEKADGRDAVVGQATFPDFSYSSSRG